MCLSRDDVRYYLRALYRFLKEGHRIEFKKHRGYYGMIFHDPEREGYALVTLDHRDRCISTLIHEFLHHHHEDWSESKVIDMERRLINALSDRQVRNLIKRFAEAI
jgi:hypothetical protein